MVLVGYPEVREDMAAAVRRAAERGPGVRKEQGQGLWLG